MRGFSFRHRPIRSLGQRSPDKAREFARDGGDDVLVGFAAGGEPVIPTMQALLRRPRPGNDLRRCATLPRAQRGADKRSMPIVPRGFDEYPSEVGIARFGDGAARPFGPTGVLRWDEPDLGHGPRRRRETARIPQFGGDGQRRQIVDPAETAQIRHARL